MAIGERSQEPLFLGPDGEPLDRHGAARIVHRVSRRAGIEKRVGPHTLRHAFIAGAAADMLRENGAVVPCHHDEELHGPAP